MPDYRRWLQPGGIFFFTVVTFERRPFLASPPAPKCLGQAIREIRIMHPFKIVAMVLLPDHLHCVWSLPSGDADFSMRWRQIKTRFDHLWLPPDAPYPHEVWQPRFWEHCVRDETDLKRHVDYIHWNPVKHGHVTRARDWPYSTFARFVKMGEYDINWGQAEPRTLLNWTVPQE